MLTVGDKFPSFQLTGLTGDKPGNEFSEIISATYLNSWLVVFYWPMDFTLVCPTEIAEFGRLEEQFRKRNAQLLGVSTDTHYAHLAWRQQTPLLQEVKFPLLSDYRRELANALGIVRKGAGAPLRATFIVDPEGTIRWVNVNDLEVGRSVTETMRVLDALQTGELCPCGWQPGDETIKAA